MDRFRQIDATNSSIGALLLPDEEVFSLQGGIGLYDGKEKSLNQSSGTVYLTSHRLIYVDDQQPHRHSCALDLGLIKQTEYYAGFLKSSAKITLSFDPDDEVRGNTNAATSEATSTRSLAVTQSPLRDWRSNAPAADPGVAARALARWVCSICGFNNTSSAPDQDKASCQLCGVTRCPSTEADTSVARTQDRPGHSDGAASEMPMSRLTLSGSRSGNNGAIEAGPNQSGLACPVCTFANHPSMVHCEMCGSLIGTEVVENVAADAQALLSVPSAAGVPTAGKGGGDSDASSLASRMPSRSTTPKPKGEQADSVKLSFRKGGDKAFYAGLKSTLKSRTRLLSSGSLSTPGTPTGLASPAVDVDGRGGAKLKVGIDGILKAVDSSSRVQSDDMQGSLRDLEALMAKAKQMVDFAEALNSKLTRQEQQAAAARSSGDPSVPPLPDREAATLIRSSLVRLGLPAPAFTEDMARDQSEYHLELARELGGLLLGNRDAPGLMGSGSVLAKGKGRELLKRMPETERGLIGLDEVWCVWNRARGIALVPPQALRAASSYLPDLTSPSIQLKTFDSGLAVLHTPRYADSAFAARLVAYLEALEREYRQNAAASSAAEGLSATPLWGPGLSMLEIAEKENAPVLLVTEMVEMVEMTSGLVVRDEGGRSGTRWYFNHFGRPPGQAAC